MIQVIEVGTRRQQKEFVEFPLKLFKGNPYFVPPLYGDEMKIFKPGYLYYETCDAVYFNAYKDGKMVGRISGILQKASNEKTGQKRIRFTRFDCIEDFEVAKALFEAVEDWGRRLQMELICGPLNFSDLEREGLLIEGFDQPQTFEEQWNPPYYKDFIERLGYVKEVDWNESHITAPSKEDMEQLEQASKMVQKRYNVRIGEAKNGRDFLKKYKDGFCDILDKSYDNIYGTVPITESMKQLLIDNFSLVISPKSAAVILDENDNVICIGLVIPALAEAVKPSGGRLTPACLLRLIKAIRKPHVYDLCLIGVDPEWLNKGIAVVFMSELAKLLSQPGVKYAETNLNLENNAAIQNMWGRFGRDICKWRRSYVKSL